MRGCIQVIYTLERKVLTFPIVCEMTVVVCEMTVVEIHTDL